MIITRTPFRVSFVGGGSDLPTFYSKHPGAVLSTTINKFIYITSHPYFYENENLFKYSQTERVSSPNQIKHDILREVFKEFKLKNLEISCSADVPSKAGLGSSSSFTVGILHNLYIRMGLPENANKRQLAEEACEIEINKLQKPNGKQDQYAAAFGGLNVIKFYPSGETEVEPLCLPQKIIQNLDKNLVMFYIGDQSRRKASSILEEQSKNMELKDKVETLKKMVGLVQELSRALKKNKLNQFGEILHQNWLLKQKLASKITNPYINTLYDNALKNGAIGGKLLGAGGGGFLLFYCPLKKQPKLRKAMSSLKESHFGFENEGSKLIYTNE